MREHDVKPDDFNGDNAHLKASIKALLSMDADGVLVPHGIGGHARGLLTAAYHRIPDDDDLSNIEREGQAWAAMLLGFIIAGTVWFLTSTMPL